MGFKITSKPPQAEKWKRRSRLDGKLILTVPGLSESCQNPRLSAYPIKHHLFTAPVNKYASNWLPKRPHLGTKLGGKIYSFPLFALLWSFLLSCPNHLVLILSGYLKMAPKMYQMLPYYQSNVLQMGGPSSKFGCVVRCIITHADQTRVCTN